MKICIALLSLIAVVFATDHHHEHGDHSDYVIKSKKDIEHYENACVSKLSVPNDLLQKYKTWEFPDDEITRCFLKCMFEEAGLFDEKNGFDVNKIHHQLAGDQVDHSDELHGKIKDCINESANASDLCTRAYRAAICFFKNNLPLVKQSVGLI